MKCLRAGIEVRQQPASAIGHPRPSFEKPYLIHHALAFLRKIPDDMQEAIGDEAADVSYAAVLIYSLKPVCHRIGGQNSLVESASLHTPVFGATRRASHSDMVVEEQKMITRLNSARPKDS